jgi:hypothetical protein
VHALRDVQLLLNCQPSLKYSVRPFFAITRFQNSPYSLWVHFVLDLVFKKFYVGGGFIEPKLAKRIRRAAAK